MSSTSAQRSRIASIVLAASLVALGASAIHWFASKTRAAPAETPADQIFSIVPLYAPKTSACETLAASAAQACHVEFALPGGDRVLGILGAKAFPALEGAPDFARAVELVSAQTSGRLDVEGWVAERSPAGAHLLQFCLRVERAGEEFAWMGWAAFDASDLATGKLVVTPLPGESMRVRAKLRGGQAVPGALVAIEPSVLPVGALPVLVSTGDDGSVRVAGLEVQLGYAVRLPEGVGPARQRIDATWSAPAAEVTLVSALGGRFEFVKESCVLPAEGASLQLDGIRAPSEKLPPAWAVCNWIGPGRGPRIAFFLIMPERTDPVATRAAAVAVAHVGAIRVDDLSRPFELTIALSGQRIAASVRQEAATASADDRR